MEDLQNYNNVTMNGKVKLKYLEIIIITKAIRGEETKNDLKT